MFAAAAGECIVRLFGTAPAVRPIWISDNSNVYKRSTNPILGFELKANYRNDDPNPNQSYPSTNAHGQRDVERSLAKPGGVRRILLLGDSVVEGHGIMDLDATMSRQLEQTYDDRTEVLNFGVSGYCTLSEIELLETKGLDFDPDVVVLVFVKNDFRNFNPVAFDLDSAVERPTIVKHLFVGSHLFRLMCLQFNLFQFGADADPAKWNSDAVGDNNVVDGLRRFRDLAADRGFLPIVAVWPSHANGQIVDEPAMPDGKSLIIERLADVNGLRSFRFSPYIRDYLKKSGGNARSLYLTADDLHPSPKGCAVAAEVLHTVLANIDRYAPAPDLADSEDREATKAAMALGTKETSGLERVHNNAARRLREEGRFDEALKELQEAIAINPDLPEAHFNFGVIYQKQGRLLQARASFIRSLELQENEEAHYNLGVILLDANELADAEMHFRAALAIKSDYVNALISLGVALARQNRIDEARAQLQRALAIEPDARAHNNLAGTYFSEKRYALAIDDYRKAIELDPAYFAATLNLAMALEATGERQAATEQYRRALELRPTDPSIHAALNRLNEPK